MNIHRRRVVSYIAASLVRPSRASAIFDLNPPHRTAFSGEISPALIAVFDSDRQDYVLGHRESDDLIRLTDLACRHPIDLTVRASAFEGVDHETGMGFSGNIEEDLVRFFDRADETTYEYRI